MYRSKSAAKLHDRHASISPLPNVLPSYRTSPDEFQTFQREQMKERFSPVPILYRPKSRTRSRSSPSHSRYLQRYLNAATMVPQFRELASTVDINLPAELLKHLITLLQLGVPADDVFLLLKGCVNASPIRIK